MGSLGASCTNVFRAKFVLKTVRKYYEKAHFFDLEFNQNSVFESSIKSQKWEVGFTITLSFCLQQLFLTSFMYFWALHYAPIHFL